MPVAARLISVATLASLALGCDRSAGNLAGAGGAGGPGVAGNGGGMVCAAAGRGGGAGSGGSGGGAAAPTCAVPPVGAYGDFSVCHPVFANGYSFDYNASGVLMAVSAPSTEQGDCSSPGARRLTVRPPSGAATFVDIYAVGDADISAWLLPLVGTTVSIQAAHTDLSGHRWHSLFVSDARGPVVYVVNSSSCPGEPPFGTPKPAALAALTVEQGAALCLELPRMRGNFESLFMIDCQTALTLAPSESGRVTIGGHSYDVHSLACSVSGPGFTGGDDYPAGAWTLKRAD